MAIKIVLPISDVSAGWDTSTGGNHYGEIDEDISDSYSDADYVETSTIDSADEFGLTDMEANCNEVTNIEVHIRGSITDSSGNAYIRAELFHTAGTPLTDNPQDCTQAQFGGDGVIGTVTKTWSSDTLTKAQADSLQLKLTFKTT